MTTQTYTRQIAAHILGSDDTMSDAIAILPDAVAADQRAYDGQQIEVLVDGEPVAAILRGDLYALQGAGTGDPVVELANRWDLIEYGYHYITVAAKSAEHALEIARGNVERANYESHDDEDGGTVYVDIIARNTVTGDELRDTVVLDPDEPACLDSEGHDWQSPIALVGGIKENPGVWGHGGGVIITEACLRCGCKRTTDTWAQRMDTGEQGLTEVTYAPGHYDLDELAAAE